VTARILHVSDLHLGGDETLDPAPALRELATDLAPELVLATGDLGHRGRQSELVRAAELLGSLGAPVLAVPGNHDIPYTVPARFTHPFTAWERVFGRIDPVHRSEMLIVVGLNSVRPWRQQGGALSDTEMSRMASELARAPEGALRVVALHHHLAAPPWRAAHKRPLRRRNAVLQAFVEAGAELVAAGHVHQAAIAEHREFEALEDGRRGSLVLATAPGFGRPRPRRKGEARGVNVYEAEADVLTVTTHAWDGSTFAVSGRRTFQRL